MKNVSFSLMDASYKVMYT